MNKKKRIIVSVISDLVTDQRVHKVCQSLHQHGYHVQLIGAKRKHSKPLTSTDYHAQRISMIFQKGFLFYAEWNIRLWLLLFFKKADVLVANDLDTLLPNYLHSYWRRKKLVYDSHEYFTEQAELAHRKTVKKIWQTLEAWLFPKLKNVYTVNNSIAHIYSKKYGVPVSVVKNVPLLHTTISHETTASKNKIIMVQGTGLNNDRGLEELVAAMALLPDEYVLRIIGSGLVLHSLQQLVQQQKLQHKVQFEAAMPKAQLDEQTKRAFCGVSLDKPTCLNHEYALPNKIFDFMHAGVPVVVSHTTEVAALVQQEKIGIVITAVQPNTIAAAIQQLGNNTHDYEAMKANCAAAKLRYNWQNEEQVILNIYNNLQ